MSLPSDYNNEISALNREILKHKPADVLQFCADFFQRRLSSQRHEFVLSQRHSSQPGIAESTFPGGNPFSSSATTSSSSSSATAVSSTAAGSTATAAGTMRPVAEEEEHDLLASPTQTSFPTNARTLPTGRSLFQSAAPDDNSSGGTFGNFGGFGGSLSSGAQGANTSASSGAMDQSSSFPNNYNLGRRTSVSAESLAPASADDATWKAPNYPKSADQLSRLRAAVSHNFLFSHLDDDQTTQVLGALQERKIPAKDIHVIEQGDTGDYFYVVEAGSFDIYVSSTGKPEGGPSGLGTRVAGSGPGTSFGELALMYNAPRAATVVSSGPSILWQLDRVTFRRILMDSAFQRRRMYESFLESVPLLSTLTPYERSKIADALETTRHPAGSTIIREGDVGDKFFLLEAGTAEVRKRGHATALKTYAVGDYFGELALLEDQPRAASVVSTTEVKVATLGKDGFQRLLGPVESIMRRDDPRKAAAKSEGVDPLQT